MPDIDREMQRVVAHREVVGAFSNDDETTFVVEVAGAADCLRSELYKVTREGKKLTIEFVEDLPNDHDCHNSSELEPIVSEAVHQFVLLQQARP
jgi:hypothetical protein